MSEFHKFAQAVNKKLQEISKYQLFVADVSREAIWDAYLESFMPEDNKMVVERREHDCNCCKNFLRDIGRVVVFHDGVKQSIWDNLDVDPIYRPSVSAMRDLVMTADIKNVFLHDVKNIGCESNISESGVRYHHFYHAIDSKFIVTRDKATLLGDHRTNFEMLQRALNEIPVSVFETVGELIQQGSLYRGDEFLSLVSFGERQAREYAKQKDMRNEWLWVKSVEFGAKSRFRNSVMGTLLTDLAEGKELDAAVASYEAKVAPTNYKRPTALVTVGMVKQAQEKVAELGLENSLQRRFAVDTDLSINNVLFANKDIKKAMNVWDDLTNSAQKPVAESKNMETVSAEVFLKDILPKAKELSLLVKSNHETNFMSLLAPVHKDAPHLFKWKNGFSWSYNGGVTDSIRERVKKAGGNVDAPLRISLSWSNFDDLDLHVKEPNFEIYFRDKNSPNGGHLDVDENAGRGKTRTPVENVYYRDLNHMRDGEYRVVVHNFAKRETSDVGFELEIVTADSKHSISCSRAVKDNEHIHVATIKMKGGLVENITVNQSDAGIRNDSAPREIWGVMTNNFVPVKMVMNSPNHWDGEETGNKHLFFILQDCINPDPARGFYNEFLRPELEVHRKVFEVLGSQMKAEHSEAQLSGLGFSITKKDSIIVKVGGAYNRVIKVQF